MNLAHSIAEPLQAATQERLRLIALMRGRYVVPVLAGLERLGYAARLLAGEKLQPEAECGNDASYDRETLAAICTYLASLDILALTPAGYAPTAFGSSLLRRAGSACILESYREYFDRLDLMLAGGSQAIRPRVDRGLNILGSGALHRRKFFEPALRLIDPAGIRTVIDLGCGDGTFLQTSLCSFSDATACVALDLSSEAVATAARRLRAHGFAGEISEITENAADVAAWVPRLPAVTGRELISAWFVLHEFCAGGAGDAIRFFTKLHQLRPGAELVVGEITRFSEQELAPYHARSIAPEFLLFHALSRQSPLSLAEWREVAAAIPYTIAGELRADWVGDGACAAPANFVWHLVPSA